MDKDQKIRLLEAEVKRLKLKMRSKENIIKSIIAKLGISKPYDNLFNGLKRMNFEELTLLENKL